MKFQSLEGIQALWNLRMGLFIQEVNDVSIPGRDSGSLERLALFTQPWPTRFQSLEGIQALWNILQLSHLDNPSAFQSLEGIQALWNFNGAFCQCFSSCFNPWKGFRLFGT